MWVFTLPYPTYVQSFMEFWRGHFSSVVDFLWNDPYMLYMYMYNMCMYIYITQASQLSWFGRETHDFSRCHGKTLISHDFGLRGRFFPALLPRTHAHEKIRSHLARATRETTHIITCSWCRGSRTAAASWYHDLRTGIGSRQGSKVVHWGLCMIRFKGQKRTLN